MYVGAEPQRIADLGKQARFGIRARAVAVAPVQAIAVPVELDPVESEARERNAPCLQHFLPGRHEWPSNPAKHRAAFGRERLDRQSLDLVNRHDLVAIGHGAAGALAVSRERAGRIDGDHASAKARSDKGMEIGNAPTSRGPRAPLLTFLRKLDLADGAAKNARG